MMTTKTTRWRGIVAGALAFAISIGVPTTIEAQVPDVGPLDCVGPAVEAAPDTPDWVARDAHNMYCTVQRHLDKAFHPVLAMDTNLEGLDAYRVPARNDGRRFRFHAGAVTNRDGLAVAIELYRPCAPGSCSAMPEGLEPRDPPYPVVILVPGGDAGIPGRQGAPKEVLRWAAQGLAEAGYVTVALDITSAHLEDAEDVLAWLLATPDDATLAGEYNPFREEIDDRRIGIAGHSGGGATANRLGQQDPRISAIVSWDRSSRYALPEHVDTPTAFFVGDYGNQPQPRGEPPDPDGTGNKVQDFLRLRDAGVDAIHLALRAANHLDWSPSAVSGNRYAEVVSLYYTLAWFDRYLKGADDPELAASAYTRLTASVFDASADVHNISQGFYDPFQAAASGDPYAGNVPYSLAGTPVADRLSFYFRSRCDLSVPGSATRAVSGDIRAHGCFHS